MAEPDAHTLSAAVRAGRVASTGFLAPDEAAQLAAAVKRVDADAQVTLNGGYSGALRRVLTAHPSHIPEASVPLAAVYLAADIDENDTRAALVRHGVAKDAIGDITEHQQGVTVVVLRSVKEYVLALRQVAGCEMSPQEVGLERLAGGRAGSQVVIVPSLRIDALGAKAFRVSRSYFGKGVAGGKVRINGVVAGKSASAAQGDEVYAESLGRFRISEVEGETRKGNLKVRLEVERV